MDNKKKCRDTIKNAGIFVCKFCDFSSSKESNYKKHLLTRKHQRIILDKKNAEPKTFACVCGKKYKYHSGLCKHKNKCLIALSEIENSENISDIEEMNDMEESNDDKDNGNDNDNENYKSMFFQLLNQNKEIMQNVIGENKELHNIIKNQQDSFNKQLSEILPKVGNTIHQNNSIHNSFKNNLNFFLNDKCKDALDIKEFLQTLIIEVSDLEYTGREGFVKGISNIFIRGLNELEVTKRPIHCTDLKRDTLYIKDEGKWGKDDNEQIVSQAIDTVKQNTFYQIQKWTQLHPQYTIQDHPHSDDYINMVKNSIGGYDETLNRNVKKVIKKLANEVYLPNDDLSNAIVE